MQAEKSRVRDQYVRRGIILCLIASLTGTYVRSLLASIKQSSCSYLSLSHPNISVMTGCRNCGYYYQVIGRGLESTARPCSE